MTRDLETGQETELQRAVKPSIVGPLAVSPDGQRLAFVQWDERGTTLLKVMPAAGGEPHDLLGVQQPEWISALVWAFDSRHLIYATAASGQARQFGLWRISAEGGEPHSLGLTMEGLSLYGLSVHPDGRHIAFTAGRPHRNEVWVLENFLPELKSIK